MKCSTLSELFYKLKFQLLNWNNGLDEFEPNGLVRLAVNDEIVVLYDVDKSIRAVELPIPLVKGDIWFDGIWDAGADRKRLWADKNVDWVGKLLWLAETGW